MLSSFILNGSRPILLALLDLPYQLMESLVNVAAQLGRGLKEGTVKGLGQHFTITKGDLSLNICLVTLVRERGKEGGREGGSCKDKLDTYHQHHPGLPPTLTSHLTPAQTKTHTVPP